ncbi:hypothetical protein CAPTEDRAFT_45709, partial [Capitella teleta]|uniref:Cadherin domain-containing protein n=1 Tax=Capitella teleta TaxID=283909 RepID=X2B4H5_CAPTE
ITILVLDVNDNAPIISIGTDAVEVQEHSAPGTTLAHITVSDVDSGAAGHINDCQTNSHSFLLQQIQQTEYRLMTQMSLDREIQDIYDVDITCSDAGMPPMSSSRTLRVFVRDVNDNSPEFTQAKYSFTVNASASVGSAIGLVQATDPDVGRNAAVDFSL